MSYLMTEPLLVEYEQIIADPGIDATDEQIVQALVKRADWTDRGARDILRLARWYGTSVLRNALALASAMQIEDGSAKL